MVPLFRCSATNFSCSRISSCVSGSRRPGSVFGAPGRSSIAWSQTVCFGSLCDSCSLNTFLCRRVFHWDLLQICFVLVQCLADDPTDEVSVVSKGSGHSLLSWYESCLLCSWCTKHHWELFIVNPSSSPVYAWLSCCKPWVPQDAFVIP
jgi:hypothetical protein